MTVKRGEIYWISLGDDGIGSEQKHERPALIIQNDIGNRYSDTTIVCFFTAQTHKKNIPTHVQIDGMKKFSTLLVEQIRTISKERIREYVGELTPQEMNKVDKAILISLGIVSPKLVIRR